MEKLSVLPLPGITGNTGLEEISAALDKVSRHAIGQAPWQNFSYKPRASFAIAHADEAILLKYFVRENFIRVDHHADNSPVHEDSCVEFFIAFNNDDAYYNLEFNCTGTCLMGYGRSRQDRQLIRPQLTRRIRRAAMIETTSEEGRRFADWELVLAIPMDVFAHHRITSLKDRQCRVNFYKCGDKLPEPHFLAWKEVTAAAPDFHLPQFFGSMQFV